MDWVAYFKNNRKHRILIPWEQGIELPDALRTPLIQSLQRFQIGETGEGRHLLRSAARLNDADYIEALTLFIAEEQEHARLLEQILSEMNGTLLKWHWSDAAFVFLRRLMGLRLEIMVLLVAEMIAKRYYRGLFEKIDDPALKAAFGQICHDEEGHIAFHIDFLNEAFMPASFLKRAIIYSLWKVVFRSVCGLVIWDHRGIFRAIGISPKEFWRDCGLIFADTVWQIFKPIAMLKKVTIPQRDRWISPAHKK